MLGIKIVNILTSSVSRLLGKEERNVRFLKLSLFQGIPNTSIGASIQQQYLNNSLTNSNNISSKQDPTIFCTAFNQNRFYLFTKRSNESDENRDINNEKPKFLSSKITTMSKMRTLGKSAIIHTTMGDIYIKLFGIECPKTVENFTIHSINNYYNNCIFHRVIRGFMIQTGDPKGDSTGGESIWGKVFADEFDRSLKHDRPGTVSMANSGPNTNGSQFFITTTEAKWLDGKHTIFARVVRGMDVVQQIENVKVENKKSYKPKKVVKIINIEIDKNN